MINLIPKEEKKKMMADFYYRLAFLFFLMFGFSVLVSIVAFLPAYFLSSAKVSAVNLKLEMQKAEPLPLSGEQSAAIVKDLNSQLNLLQNAEENKFPISEKVINAILSSKISGIKITQILYENDPTAGKKINLTGTASSRAALLLFQQTLQNNPNFKNIILPISNFVKESNIEFNLILIPA
jgi:Tfp pilus assembly protein PilN